MRTIATMFCVLVLVFLLTGLASAAPITVANSSFQDDSAHAYPVPWYWQGAGEKFPSTAGGRPLPPDGSSLIARMSNGSYGAHDPGDGGQTRAAGVSNVEQTLTTLAAPNTTYTLTVDTRNDNGDNPLFPIKLIPLLHHADGTALGGMSGDGLLSLPNEAVNQSTDPWQTFTYTWTTDGTEPGTQFLRIGFATDNSQAGGTVDFDNILLNATPIPEPSTVALLATGLVGLLACDRRKRR